MKINFNDKELEIGSGATVCDLVRSAGLNPDRVIIELNGELVLGENWTQSILKENDQVFAVTFVGGG